jgi:hypothetical protein
MFTLDPVSSEHLSEAVDVSFRSWIDTIPRAGRDAHFRDDRYCCGFASLGLCLRPQRLIEPGVHGGALCVRNRRRTRFSSRCEAKRKWGIHGDLTATEAEAEIGEVVGSFPSRENV